MDVIKVAIIGLRHLHPRSYMAHFRQINEFQVVAVAEADVSLRRQFAADFSLRSYPDWQQLLEHETIDLVAIFLPHSECPAAAAAALEKGTHVLIEKPMAADAHSAEKLVNLAKKQHLILTTPYVWRYHPVVQDIKKLLAAGSLGQVIGCAGRCAAGRLERYEASHAEWMLDAQQSGGGPMFNLGVHWIDLFTWLLNVNVHSVFSKNLKINQHYNIEDNSFAILTFASGVVLTLDISYTVPAAYPHGRELYIGIRGTQGVIQWSPAFEGESDELFICSDHESFKGAPVQRRLYTLESAPGYSGIMGLLYLKELAAAIRQRTAAPIPGEDGVRVLKIVEAIYRSADQHRIETIPN
ncbi:MAG: Gfo/Idh/MocA family oxidoreductase [candidate division KSB1 bacterium]|nr:Gfo/Idh/MocA family oxidoreductase [candidate division KSB1 bacterium]MDZ7317936.1 Gfo/Idh/MocA family oxidoreductase [candidate division KSB1 bacterium]